MHYGMHAIMHRKDVIPTTITSASLPAKKRILTVCVKLFLEQGYKKTTVSEIVHKASVSNSIFQNFDVIILTQISKAFSGIFKIRFFSNIRWSDVIYIYVPILKHIIPHFRQKIIKI